MLFEIINNLKRLKLNDLDVMTRLDHEVQRREKLGSGSNLQGNNYLKICFHKTNVLNERTYVKFPITTNSILNIQNYDTYCFLWSILASIHPVRDHPYRVTKYTCYQHELNFTNTGFTNGIKIVDMPIFEILNPTLSVNEFEYSTDEDNDYELVPL